MMLQLAQAADTGIDFAKLLGIGSPAAIGGGLIFYLTKLWLDSRKANREDTKTERESESQIVATTDALAKLVREQMIDMAAESKALKLQMEEMRRQHNEELEKLRERITALEAENESLRAARLRDRKG